MSVKFKIGFTIPAETLFGLVAKFLPIEDLSVEEVAERASPLVTRKPPKTVLVAPKKHHKKRVNGKVVTLTAGVNKIVLDLLADGKPHKAREVGPLIEAEGYSPSGVGSRLNRLKQLGVVFQPGVGLWQIADTAGPEPEQVNP